MCLPFPWLLPAVTIYFLIDNIATQLNFWRYKKCFLNVFLEVKYFRSFIIADVPTHFMPGTKYNPVQWAYISHIVGARGLVDKTLDSRSNVWSLIPTANHDHIWKWRSNFSFHLFLHIQQWWIPGGRNEYHMITDNSLLSAEQIILMIS